MGARGPKPKPTFLRLLEGNPGKRALNPAEANVPLADTLPCPDFFDAERQQLWTDVTGELAAMRGLSPVDYQMLLLYVDTVADCRRLMRKMAQAGDSMIAYRGHATTDKDGKTQQGAVKSAQTLPYFNQLITQKNLALRFADRFGMTPSARARIVLLGQNGEPTEDPLD